MCKFVRLIVSQEKQEWSASFFSFSFQQCFSLLPPSPFLLGRFSQAVLLPSAAFLSRSKAGTKNVMCILDKEICDVGTFLFFALHVLGFFFLSHGGGEKRHSNAFWCCSIKRRSCIWFSFFPLFFFLTVMMLKWCSCVT